MKKHHLQECFFKGKVKTGPQASCVVPITSKNHLWVHSVGMPPAC